ncbi:MAG: sulfite exporter TauE/SafE family protein [Planctomycetota bacterium]
MLYMIIGALLVGVSLGLMGSGGSILTVPILTFVLGQQEKVAIASSLAIVGGICLVAGVPYVIKKQVDFRSVLFFGLPGMVGAFGGALMSKHVSGLVQLVVFALVMLLAGGMMLRGQDLTAAAPLARRRSWKVILDGLAVGALTGFVGVGGGFMIVPALVLLGGLSMHRAVGTSIFIIALKSASGFAGYLKVLDERGLSLDWKVIGVFVLMGSLGSFAGTQIGTRLPQAALRKSFAYFLLVMGAYVIWHSVR